MRSLRSENGRTCKARNYLKSMNGECQSACHNPVYANIEGHDLCWLHQRVIQVGRATVEEVLNGQRSH